SSGSEPGEPSPREGVWPTPANTRGYAARFRSVAVAIRPRTGTRRDGLLYESWIVKTMKSAEQGLNRHLPELLEAIRGGTPQARVEASGRLFGRLIRAMPSRAGATPIELVKWSQPFASNRWWRRTWEDLGITTVADLGESGAELASTRGVGKNKLMAIVN